MPLHYDMVATLKDARRRMADTDHYDLLVTDLRLPDGRGTEILGEFHRRFPESKVLIVTGSLEMPPSVPSTPEVPGTEWIFKPFEIEDFIAALKRLLTL